MSSAKLAAILSRPQCVNTISQVQHILKGICTRFKVCSTLRNMGKGIRWLDYEVKYNRAQNEVRPNCVFRGYTVYKSPRPSDAYMRQ